MGRVKNRKGRWQVSGYISSAVAVMLLGSLLIACGPKTVVVLLPESDGSVGQVMVITQESTKTLDQPYESAHVGAGDTVRSGGVLDANQIQKTFGEALESQPLPPVVFTLYFKNGGTKLTKVSSALIPDILESITQRRSSDISLVGHTDRVGSADRNRILSMDRASYVAEVLTVSGVDLSLIDVSFHGESNPLIPTEDEVAEPKNRRVEVIVR